MIDSGKIPLPSSSNEAALQIPEEVAVKHQDGGAKKTRSWLLLWRTLYSRTRCQGAPGASTRGGSIGGFWNLPMLREKRGFQRMGEGCYELL